MHHHDVGCFMHTFPLFRYVQCYAYHACLCHPLAFYASLQTFLHVHAWVLLVSVSSMLQYNEIMDIWSKPTFVPYGHHLLFPFLLVCLITCLPSRLFACFLVSLFAMSIMLVYFMPLSHSLCISFFPLLVCWFLVLTFACTYMKWECKELGHSLLGPSKKGEDASM